MSIPMRKYICPNCFRSFSVRKTEVLNIKCGICDERMVIAPPRSRYVKPRGSSEKISD